jgi:FAD:protein FMN transferase
VIRPRTIAAALLFVAIPARALPVREAHYVMGTVLEVTVEAPDLERGRTLIRDAIGVARRLDRELTTYDPTSPLMRLNGAAGTGESAIPADLFRALRESRGLWQATGGVFDPTIGPLLRLWAQAKRADRLPSEAELAAARRLVGFANVKLVPPDRAALVLEGMSVDLGGIGKGYAVDRMIDRLRDLGMTAALVNFGESSVGALGAPAGEEGWELWVRRGRRRIGPIRIKDAALSTSRSLARRRTIGGTRMGDIIDPRSGRPLTIDCQATVRSRSATEAEAWSKALLIDAAASFASFGGEREGFLLCTDAVRASPLFAELVQKQN